MRVCWGKSISRKERIFIHTAHKLTITQRWFSSWSQKAGIRAVCWGRTYYRRAFEDQVGDTQADVDQVEDRAADKPMPEVTNADIQILVDAAVSWEGTEGTVGASSAQLERCIPLFKQMLSYPDPSSTTPHDVDVSAASPRPLPHLLLRAKWDLCRRCPWLQFNM